MRRIVLTLWVLSLCGAAPGHAAAAAGWQDGVAQYTSVQACTGIYETYTEVGAGAWSGMYYDPANLPKVGEVFWIRSAIAGLGNPCPGTLVSFQFALPAGLELAISAQNPVVCAFAIGGGNWIATPEICPQRPTRGPNGFVFDPTTRDGIWLLPQGRSRQVIVPVRATRPMSGAAGDAFVAHIAVIDGQSNSTLRPSQWINVAAAPGQPDTSDPGPTGTPGGSTPSGPIPGGPSPGDPATTPPSTTPYSENGPTPPATSPVPPRPPDPPVPPMPPADTTSPVGAIAVPAVHGARRLGRGLTAAVTCSESATATARLTVGKRDARVLRLPRTGVPTTLATATQPCTPGRRASIQLRPTRGMAARIRGIRRRWTGALELTLTDGSGNTGTARTVVTFNAGSLR